MTAEGQNRWKGELKSDGRHGESDGKGSELTEEGEQKGKSDGREGESDGSSAKLTAGERAGQSGDSARD